MKLLGYSVSDNAYIVEVTEDELAKMGIPKSKIIAVLEKSGKSIAFLRESAKDRIQS